MAEFALAERPMKARVEYVIGAGLRTGMSAESIAAMVFAMMRDPTEAMQVAGHAVRVDIPHCGTDEIYTAMIDAALEG